MEFPEDRAVNLGVKRAPLSDGLGSAILDGRLKPIQS
jgi:hypothetical protein